MAEKFYVKNATNKLEQVLVCSPLYYKFNAINEITKSWMEKGDTEKNNVMVEEWEAFLDIYRENGVEVIKMKPDPKLEVMTFARDFGGMIKEGAIIGHFRHPARQKETEIYEAKLQELGIPIVARVNAGCFEGGDIWMLDEHTIALGLVDRTDEAGVANLRDQLSKYGYTVVGVPVPPANLHLDMVFNIVTESVCLAATRELPYHFLEMVKRRGFTIIDVPSEDVFKHGCNVQAIGDNKVIAIKNNKAINDKMRAAGVEVIEVPFDQVLHGGGGPHCLTFPIKRA
ncbi:dimethylarginine dimethylaminohydrolase family protein [Bacillus tuaregi]|uniref:dimethylarginine dimethylaminohydrolase family protein n=1 Tax=Bacillus tuaregi TaxID=1816695 RepID=UPI0008F94E73|nr:arginine deiminase family protein [Bacillus tuaregi]